MIRNRPRQGQSERVFAAAQAQAQRLPVRFPSFVYRKRRRPWFKKGKGDVEFAVPKSRVPKKMENRRLQSAVAPNDEVPDASIRPGDARQVEVSMRFLGAIVVVEMHPHAV